MKISHRALRLSALIAMIAPAIASEPPYLDSHLEPLRPLLGKTWKGEFKNSIPEKPVVDIARWERALNGKAVRILHSINDGLYGGESIIMWDEKQRVLSSHYFTTASFTTTGTVRFTDGKILAHEIVSGNTEGVREVRATTEIRRDGTVHVRSEHLKDGAWMPGHEAVYKEDEKATVVFK